MGRPGSFRGPEVPQESGGKHQELRSVHSLFF